MSQEELERATGLDRSEISRLENGQRTPPRDTVSILARGLRLNDLDALELHVAAGYVPKSLAPQAHRIAVALTLFLSMPETVSSQPLPLPMP